MDNVNTNYANDDTGWVVGKTINVYQRNKLKGTALEKIISHTKEFNKNDNDTSIKKVLSELHKTNQLPKSFIVKKNFNISGFEYKKGSLIFMFPENEYDGRKK